MKGTRFHIELGTRGGVLKVSGFGEAARKRIEPLAKGKDKKAKAQALELQAWLSDEAWTALLDAVWVAAPPAGGKPVERRYPLPWVREFQEQALPAVPVPLKSEPAEEGVRIGAPFDHGAVDEALQFPGMPGFHSLGVSQKGSLMVEYAVEGLKSSGTEFRIRDRWDDYRDGGKADRFARDVTAALKALAVVPPAP